MRAVAGIDDAGFGTTDPGYNPSNHGQVDAHHFARLYFFNNCCTRSRGSAGTV